MKKISLTSAVATAFSLIAFETSQAEEIPMEKCQIVGHDKQGKEVGLIKEGKADCHGVNSSCSGTNAAGVKEAWLYLPKGVCEKIQGGKVVPEEKK